MITCGSTLTLDAILLNKKVIMSIHQVGNLFHIKYEKVSVNFVSKYYDLNNFFIQNYDPLENSLNDLVYYKK